MGFLDKTKELLAQNADTIRKVQGQAKKITDNAASGGSAGPGDQRN
jgi:hypothetical protein